jgi:hypothetical protein
MYAAFGLMEFVLPRRTRSELWPLQPSPIDRGDNHG